MLINILLFTSDKRLSTGGKYAYQMELVDEYARINPD